MKICHFTSVHNRKDVRICIKECMTLRDAGNEVYIVSKGNEDFVEDGITFVSCGNPKGRIQRFLSFSKKVYKKALELDCDVYHFHDPELLKYGVKLKKKGKKVIFDSHEDVPAQILDKTWIPRFLRKTVSKVYRKKETKYVRKIDAVVTATPYIEDKFKNRAKKVVTVNNYPKLDDVEFQTNSFFDREDIVCYAGGVSVQRGERIMVDAIKDIDATLLIAGVGGENYGKDVKNVQYLGKIDRKGINDLYKKSVVGLCLLQPTANYVNSQPIKMYEYMAAGLPFVCSNFPAWKKVVDSSNAGVCVDVDNKDEIVNAINTLLSNRELCENMGKAGRKAVEENYNWENEGRKLVRLYEEL